MRDDDKTKEQLLDEVTDRASQRTAELAAANEELRQEIEERLQVEAALRASESALRRSERRFRDYFEHGLIGMGAASLGKRWLHVNDRLCEMLGYSRDELVGKVWLDFTHPDDLSTHLDHYHRLLAGEIDHFTMDKRHLRKDGGIVHTSILVRLFRNDEGDADHVIALIQDVTARKLAEEALRQSHDQLRAIYDQVVDGIIVVDAETGNPIRANSAYCRMVGVHGEDVYRLSPEQVHPPEALPRVWEHLDAVKKGAVARIDDLPFLHRDGSIVYADVVTSPICYNDRFGWISFFHDITERKRAHDTLEKERRTLEHLFRSSDHERQLIAYDIHDGLAQFLAGAIMQFDTATHLKETDADEAEKAFEAGMRMLRRSHAEARRLISGVRPPILDEEGIVAAISHLTHEYRQPQGPLIELHAAVGFSRLVSIQENAIYRIVQEALANACKYSKSEKVRVGLVQQGSEIRIEVQDWGVGFDQGVIAENCFGLEGIRERTCLLGGVSSIDSAPGKGTRILVTLPLVVRDETTGVSAPRDDATPPLDDSRGKGTDA